MERNIFGLFVIFLVVALCHASPIDYSFDDSYDMSDYADEFNYDDDNSLLGSDFDESDTPDYPFVVDYDDDDTSREVKLNDSLDNRDGRDDRDKEEGKDSNETDDGEENGDDGDAGDSSEDGDDGDAGDSPENEHLKKRIIQYVTKPNRTKSDLLNLFVNILQTYVEKNPGNPDHANISAKISSFLGNPNRKDLITLFKGPSLFTKEEDEEDSMNPLDFVTKLATKVDAIMNSTTADQAAGDDIKEKVKDLIKHGGLDNTVDQLLETRSDAQESPEDDQESPDDTQESPDDHDQESPDDAQESPDDDQESSDDAQESPDDTQESPDDDDQESPDDAQESPDDDQESPDDADIAQAFDATKKLNKLEKEFRKNITVEERNGFDFLNMTAQFQSTRGLRRKHLVKRVKREMDELGESNAELQDTIEMIMDHVENGNPQQPDALFSVISDVGGGNAKAVFIYYKERADGKFDMKKLKFEGKMKLAATVIITRVVKGNSTHVLSEDVISYIPRDDVTDNDVKELLDIMVPQLGKLIGRLSADAKPKSSNPWGY